MLFEIPGGLDQLAGRKHVLSNSEIILIDWQIFFRSVIPYTKAVVY